MTEGGRLGGRGGSGLFERSKYAVPDTDIDILCSVPGVLGLAEVWYTGIDEAASFPIGICTLVLLSKPRSCGPQQEVASVQAQTVETRWQHVQSGRPLRAY